MRRPTVTADAPAPDVGLEKPQSHRNSDQGSQRRHQNRSGKPESGFRGAWRPERLPRGPTRPAGKVKPSLLLAKERATWALHGAARKGRRRPPTEEDRSPRVLGVGLRPGAVGMDHGLRGGTWGSNENVKYSVVVIYENV